MSKIRVWIDKYDWEPVRKICENVIGPVIVGGCIAYLMYKIWILM